MIHRCWGVALATVVVEAAIYLWAAPNWEVYTNYSEDTDWKGD